MKTLKFICGMFLAAGLFVACSNEADVTEKTENPADVEKVGKITIDLSITTQAGEVKTRNIADVDDAGAPKGRYPFDYVYLVKANGSVPATTYKESRTMNVANGARLDIWFTDATYTKIAIQPTADKTVAPLEFNVCEVDNNGKVLTPGDTFFYSSQISEGESPIISLMSEGNDVYKEYGDKLFLSDQFVFCVDANNQLKIYQVYPNRTQIYPKGGNSVWPVDLNRYTAAVNPRFMFVDINESEPYGTTAAEVKDRWNEIFSGVSLSTIYTDGAFLTDFPVSFNLCLRTIGNEHSSIRLYGNEESNTPIQELVYHRASTTSDVATDGWGFKSKAYPFIFTTSSNVDDKSGVQMNVCIPDLNTRMKCSINFPAGDAYAFKANKTTFLWLMMDIDEFKALCVKSGVVNEAGAPTPVATRSAGMREIEVELPSDCLLVQ